MNRVLPILLGFGLAASGCAMASKSAPRNYRSSRRGSTHSYVRASVSVPQLSESTASRSRYRPTRASRQNVQPAPPSPSKSSRRSYRRARRVRTLSASSSGSGSSGRAHRRVRRVRRVAKPVAKPVAGTHSTGRTRPALATGAKIPQTRLVIYQGNLVIRVFKLRDAVDLAQKLSLETGAYIQSRNNNRLIIRVPVTRFHELFARLGAVGEVAGKSIAARDVTRQFFDVTHRLKASHAVLTRLKNLLLKARNVRESLAIEREMSRLLTRIEQYKGLLRYLKHHASLSTINIYFRVKPRYSRPIRTNLRSPFGWVKGLGLWRMMRF